jgi:hypothetical protein
VIIAQGVQTRVYISIFDAEKNLISTFYSLVCGTFQYLCNGNCRLDVWGEKVNTVCHFWSVLRMSKSNSTDLYSYDLMTTGTNLLLLVCMYLH